MEEKELSKTVELVKVKKEIPTMTVNGVVQQTQTSEQCILVCPTCKKQIFEFDINYTEKDVRNALNTTETQNAMLDIAKYCSGCGQKLSYENFIIVDNA